MTSVQNENVEEPVKHKNFKFLKSLTHLEKQNFLNSFDVVFCDCDGVIWHVLREAIPGSAEAIDYLRKKDKEVVFVTNNSLTSIEDIIKKFQRFNINVEKKDIIHPAQTVADHLKSIQFDGLIYCLASSQFRALLGKEGFQLVDEKPRVFTECLQELHNAIYSKDPVKAVVIDVDLNMTGAKLMRAHVHLKDPECLFIGGAADVVIPFGDGDVIGPGPYITVAEITSKRKATILGKPGVKLCELLKQRYQLKDPRRAIFIGDSLTSDIKFGKLCGFQTLLVLTGATKETDLSTGLTECEMPDYVAQKLGDVVELL